jgi:hypothetical protein
MTMATNFPSFRSPSIGQPDELYIPAMTACKGKANAMIEFFSLEARQSDGSIYRLAFGAGIHPQLASMLNLLLRLF